MRRNSKRLNVLISSLLVCALPCWYALADSGSPTHEPTATAALEVSPTMAATASLPPDAGAFPESTAAPAASPDSQPTAELTPEASPDTTASPGASDAPTPSATPAPSGSSAPSATPAPSDTPGASVSPAPSASPVVSPTPTVYPTLSLGMQGDAVLKLQLRLIELGYLSYSADQGGATGGTDTDGNTTGGDSTGGDTTGGDTTGGDTTGDNTTGGNTTGDSSGDDTVGSAQPSGIYDEATKNAVMLFQARVSLEVTGIADDATQQLLYSPNAPAYDPNATPMPSVTPGGGFPGGFPGGSFPSLGGMMGGMLGAGDMAAEPVGVVPGVALTSSHSSGERDMTLYGAIPEAALTELDGQATTQSLNLGDVQLDIELLDESGAALEFSATCADGTLTLSSQQSGTWRVNGYALRTLELSGITMLQLDAAGASAELPTGEPLIGEVYARLRTQGLVSHDFAYVISSQLTVEVAGESYSAQMSDAGISLSAPEQG